MNSAPMFFAMCVIKTKKREGPLSVTRPAFRGLRIAYQCRTSNAEASRGYVYNKPLYQ